MDTLVGDDADARIAALRSVAEGTLFEKLGIEITELAAERIVGTMPVEGNRQPMGLLHGGASVALAETLGSVGAMVHAGVGGRAVGIEISASHHRAATTGRVTGVATPIHLGRTLVTYQIEIRDDADRLVCTSKITCMILPPR